MACLGY